MTKLGFSGTAYLKSNLTAIAHTIIANSWVMKNRKFTLMLRKAIVVLQSCVKMFQVCMVSILYHLLLWGGGKNDINIALCKMKWLDFLKE